MVRKGPTRFISKGIPCDCHVAANAQPRACYSQGQIFKRQVEKRWPVGVIAAAPGENKTEQGWVERQRHQRFVHCRLIK